jgi:hypothetical protein
LESEDKQKAKAPKVTLKIPCADPKCEEKKNEPFAVIPAITVTIFMSCGTEGCRTVEVKQPE